MFVKVPDTDEEPSARARLAAAPLFVKFPVTCRLAPLLLVVMKPLLTTPALAVSVELVPSTKTLPVLVFVNSPELEMPLPFPTA
jgi:hypothetical protein